jgi:hypothetical protein
MAEEAETASWPAAGEPAERTTAASGAGGGDPFEQRPELMVAGAFAGGFALALALRWLGRGRD